MQFILDRDDYRHAAKILEDSPTRARLQRALVEARSGIEELAANVAAVRAERAKVDPLGKLTSAQESAMLKAQMLEATLPERIAAVRRNYFDALRAWTEETMADFAAIHETNRAKLDATSVRLQGLVQTVNSAEAFHPATAEQAQREVAEIQKKNAPFVALRNQAEHGYRMVEAHFSGVTHIDITDAKANPESACARYVGPFVRAAQQPLAA